jgi:hypothetical protein
MHTPIYREQISVDDLLKIVFRNHLRLYYLVCVWYKDSKNIKG